MRTARKPSPHQSGYKVEREIGNPELNPYVNSNPFNILVVEEVKDIAYILNLAITAKISILGSEKDREVTPASTVKTDLGRFVYAKSSDITASGSTPTGVGRQAELADDNIENRKKNRYLHHSALKDNVGEVKERSGHSFFFFY